MPGGVWPPKSDTSPSSAFLLIRTSGASPTPCLLSLLLGSSLLLSPLSSPFSVLLSLFLSFFLCLWCSVLPSCHSALHFSLEDFPISFSLLSSTVSFVSSWKTTGEKAGLGRCMFLALTAVLSYSNPPPPRCTLPVNRQFLTVVYLHAYRKLYMVSLSCLPHRLTVFSQKSNGTGKYI